MHAEILLSRGETVTSFELPSATKVRVVWPEPKQLTITVPAGSAFSVFGEHFQEILHPFLVSHLKNSWPSYQDLRAVGKSVPVEPWGEVQIDISTKKESKEKVDIDRPRLTIQMGHRVNEFTDHYRDHFKPEFFDQVIRLWSDPEYCRTVLPVGRNLLIRGCA
jgi:hypothetical protein